MVAAGIVSAVLVVMSAGMAAAVPGTVKISSLHQRSVPATRSAELQAAKPPPPPRHFRPPTSQKLPHTGPAIPAPLARAAGILMIVLGSAGAGILHRMRKAAAQSRS